MSLAQATPLSQAIGRLVAPPQERPDASDRLLAGLVGCGIGASRSPALHEEEGRRHGLRYRYRLLDLEGLALGADGLDALLEAAAAEGYAGLNVTHPFKQSVVAALDTLAADAAAVGAVNTVVFRDGRRIGHNTDLWGFAESFRRGMAGAALGAVLLCGCGGAGSAVAHALLSAGVGRLALFDREGGRAEGLRAALSNAYGDRAEVVDRPVAGMAAVDGIVNATPVGMEKYPGLPVPAEALTAAHWVADIVYFPAETPLLAAARRLGCRTLGGSAMAAYQAAKAFELFTGHPADAERMVRSLRAD